MSQSYVELTHTNYPEQEDKLRVFRDPSVSEMVLVNQYNSLMANGQVASAIELLKSNPSLKECIINADTLLTLHHQILAVQRFFYDSVQEKIYRIGSLKGDWTETMSSDAENENDHLNMYDIVRYPVEYLDISSDTDIDFDIEDANFVDVLPTNAQEETLYVVNNVCYIYDEFWENIGRVETANQYFMVVSNDINAGEIPLVYPDKYMQMTIKGEKGDAGYTPIKGIDYDDGENGLGLAPTGAWVQDKAYKMYDMVSHNGYLWYTVTDLDGDLRGIEPTDGSEYWIKMDIVLQLAVGTEAPNFLEEGGLWLHLQNDGHVILRTKDDKGYYSTLYPETYAKYIFDETGANLQKKIYQHYFNRDDVMIEFLDTAPTYTMTAYLVDNPNVVVAKSVLTDNSLVNGTKIEEFTTYDETGVFITYQNKRTYTAHGNGRHTINSEVIVQEHPDKTEMLEWSYI